jgi:2-polyprenyl-3-methyl-5-hydroxy-6-metoxy-1,4-benzoquinol methylase
MICSCCFSKTIELNPLGLQDYAVCNECGLIFTISSKKSHSQASILRHYRKEDPHSAVAFSKKKFFSLSLKYLSSKIFKAEKTILDVGCGHGEFLELASKNGWSSFGVEIVNEAAERAKKKIGNRKIFQGKLREANFPDNSFDTITLWDVIAIVDNPYDELKECFRLLEKGGIIGIRTRNVVFQTFVFRSFSLIKKIALRFALKEPYVFNKYCFSRKSIYTLLSNLGFINIKIVNSPLTSGDPYNHIPFNYTVKIAKICIDICSQLVFSMTRGKRQIAPSILIWAEKP